MDIKIDGLYKWTKGPNFNTVEEVKCIENGKVVFKSGNVVKQDVFNEFLLATSEEDIKDQQQFNANAYAIPPTVAPETKETVAPKESNSLSISEDMLLAALDKSESIETFTVKIDVKYLEKPIYDFMQVAHESFGDVYKKLIKTQVKDAIEEAMDAIITSLYDKNS